MREKNDHIKEIAFFFLQTTPKNVCVLLHFNIKA